MRHRTRSRTARRGAVAAVLLSTALLPAHAAGAQARTTPPPSGVTLFPSNDLTVADPTQLTGRRVNLPLPDCATRPSDCDDVRLLNQLDGFDLDPRIAVDFSGPVDLEQAQRRVHLREDGTDERIRLNRFVYDAASNTLYGQPVRQLKAGTTYDLVVPPAVAGRVARTEFTTYSATTDLLKLRRQLDDSSAYAAAGIAEHDRSLRFDQVVPGSELVGITRLDDRGPADLVPVPVTNLATAEAGAYAFGSFLSPSWLNDDQVIPATPTKTGAPQVTRHQELGFVLIVPDGPKPEGGWPVAVFGHGFGGTKTSVFSAADLNAQRGLATIATDVVGHGFGPRSEIELALSGDRRVRVPARGRAVDVDGDGAFTSTEGSSPRSPGPLASIGSRDGLRQTVADIMALVRAVERGVDVDHDGSVDLRPTHPGYYGQSFGGIYGTMLGGVDPKVPFLSLNVPGGPTNEIVRLSPVFRPLASAGLGGRVPSLLNGGPGGFTESLPLYLDPAVLDPAPGALAIQQVFANQNWLQRSGNPTAFAPLLRLRPPSDSYAKSVLFQYAFGDQTVPNPTSANITRAGELYDVTTYYRNDRTPTAARNPHGVLTDPTIAGRPQSLDQISTFLASGGASIIDPDGPGDVWEVPIVDRDALERLNYYTPPPAP